MITAHHADGLIEVISIMAKFQRERLSDGLRKRLMQSIVFFNDDFFQNLRLDLIEILTAEDYDQY